MQPPTAVLSFPWWLDVLGVLTVKLESCSDPSSHVQGSGAETYQQLLKNKKQDTKNTPSPKNKTGEKKSETKVSRGWKQVKEGAWPSPAT